MTTAVSEKGKKMKLIDKNKFLEGLNVNDVLKVIDEETLYDSDSMEYKLPMMSLFARLLKLTVVDAVERSEYEKMKELCEQYRYERDVLEEIQRNRDEVVHCRDCKRRDTMKCPRWPQRISVDDCCSSGERERKAR